MEEKKKWTEINERKGAERTNMKEKVLLSPQMGKVRSDQRKNINFWGQDQYIYS